MASPSPGGWPWAFSRTSGWAMAKHLGFSVKDCLDLLKASLHFLPGTLGLSWEHFFIFGTSINNCYGHGLLCIWIWNPSVMMGPHWASWPWCPSGGNGEANLSLFRTAEIFFDLWITPGWWWWWCFFCTSWYSIFQPRFGAPAPRQRTSSPPSYAAPWWHLVPRWVVN